MRNGVISLLITFLVIIQVFGGVSPSDKEKGAMGTPKKGIISTDTTWNSTLSPYWIEGNIIILNGVTLAIEPGVEVKFNGYYAIFVEGNINATGSFGNMVVFTSNYSVPSVSNWVGIQVNSTGHVIIKYAEIKYGDWGVYILSSNNSIRNCNISYDFFGIEIASSSNNTIINNRFSFNQWTDLLLDWTSNNTIESNNFVNNGIRIWGSLISHFNTHTIPENNIVNGKPLYYYKNCNNIEIDEIQVGQVIFANCTDITIRNLQINNTDVGIEIAFSTNVLIANNDVFNNGDGISLTLSNDSIIVNNNVSSNEWGIRLLASSNNLVVSNKLFSNGDGIYLYVSTLNLITSNFVTGSVRGIFPFAFSDSNLITNNNVSQNGNGIYVQSSSKNRIYHNNIIDSIGNQAFDDMDDNFWNDTYPSGGNYFSDYGPICQDLYDGPVTPQTAGIPDGICDAQYNIDADSADFYPLTTPFIQGISPMPPTNLTAQLSGLNNENVTIRWNLSGDDISGKNNVIGYFVYYSNNFTPLKEGYDVLAFVPNGTNIYVHSNSGEGNPSNYFYYIEAIDTGGNGCNTTEQVSKFTRYLKTGPHLVSIPLILQNRSLLHAFQTLDFETIWYFNSTDIIDPWKSYNKFKSLNDLIVINRTMAFWIRVPNSSNFTVAGIVPQVTNISLKVGWNFVGYPSFIKRNVSTALSGINYERIEGYVDKPPQYLQLYSDDDFMISGHGCWIKVKADATLKLTN